MYHIAKIPIIEVAMLLFGRECSETKVATSSMID